MGLGSRGTFTGVEGAALFLRVSKSTIYAWVHQKKIPYRKHGRKLIFCRDELKKWSDHNRMAPDLYY